MDEDCLFINVWTPGVDDGLRPVMVWVHGGGNLMGSGSSYEGSAFAREGVVLVSMNYRLHALGLLYLADLSDGAEGTGNLSCLDQIAALEWVRDNIAAFGSDPENVTVFGQSASGTSIGALMGTPRANGLFHRAVLRSGACHFSISPTAGTRVARRVLELLEIGPGDWDALRTVAAERIAQVANQVVLTEFPDIVEDERTEMNCFQPVIDGRVRPAAQLEMVRNGGAGGVDVHLGTAAEEQLAYSLRDADVPDETFGSFLEPAGRSVDEVLKIYAASRPGATRRELIAAVLTDYVFRIPLSGSQSTRWLTTTASGCTNPHGRRQCSTVRSARATGWRCRSFFGLLDDAAPLVGDNPPVDLGDDIRSSLGSLRDNWRPERRQPPCVTPVQRDAETGDGLRCGATDDRRSQRRRAHHMGTTVVMPERVSCIGRQAQTRCCTCTVFRVQSVCILRFVGGRCPEEDMRPRQETHERVH